MSRAGWASFIGIFSGFVYGLLAVYMFTGLTGFHNIGQEEKVEDDNKSVDPDTKDDDSAEVLVEFTRHQVTAYTILLVKHIIMMVVSILLVVGVKQHQHKFMAPWIFVGAVSMIVNVSSMVFDDKADGTFVAEFVALVLTVAIWYPIFTYYKKIRHNQKPVISVESCRVNPYYAPCAPPASNVEYVHSAPVVPSVPTTVEL